MSNGRRDRARAGVPAPLLAVLAALVVAAGCSSSPQRTTPPPTTRPPAGPTADPGAPKTSPSPTPTGSSTAGGVPSPAGPTAQTTPVFVDEPCDPDAGPGPQQAINGLQLYCVPTRSGVSLWSTAPPPTPTPSPQTRGSLCDTQDRGKVVRGADGRPLECVRDPDGRYRWVDVS